MTEFKEAAFRKRGTLVLYESEPRCEERELTS